MMISLKKKNGFSLIEIAVSFVIFVLIIGVIFAVLTAGEASWYISTVHIELQQDLRRAAEWIINEVRHTGSGYINGVPPDGSWQNTISFYKPAGEAAGYKVWDFIPVQYSLSGINNAQLTRVYGNETWVLANNVTLFQVRRMAESPGLLEVEIQAQKRSVSRHLVSDAITFEIELRN